MADSDQSLLADEVCPESRPFNNEELEKVIASRAFEWGMSRDLLRRFIRECYKAGRA